MISIVIPTYNERESITPLLERLARTLQVRDAIRTKVEEFIKAAAAGKLAALDFSLKTNKDE
jgi:glycosyltransferase involved in cell wall biosynthesis